MEVPLPHHVSIPRAPALPMDHANNGRSATCSVSLRVYLESLLVSVYGGKRKDDPRTMAVTREGTITCLHSKTVVRFDRLSATVADLWCNIHCWALGGLCMLRRPGPRTPRSDGDTTQCY